MNKDFIININSKTSDFICVNRFNGVDGENLQGNIIFNLSEEITGIGRVEVKSGCESFIVSEVERDGTKFTMPIKSNLLNNEYLSLQLVITQSVDNNEVAIFKSKMIYLKVNKSINAESEEPSVYIQWIDIANQKLAQVDNVNAEMTENQDGDIVISITDKNGTTNTETIDIQSKINTHNLDETSHPSLVQRISNLEQNGGGSSGGGSSDADINNAINQHNTSNSSHQDIRNSINTNISSAINQHNSSNSAHTDIRENITSAVNTHNSSSSAHSNVVTRVSDIESLIPSGASSSNQLADKNYVDTEIANIPSSGGGSGSSDITTSDVEQMISDHNSSSTAHSDIRSEITTDISSHNESSSAHSDIRQAITTDISTHNSSDTAHGDIRQAITDDISAHNSSSSAHSDIRTDITNITNKMSTNATPLNRLIDKDYVDNKFATLDISTDINSAVSTHNSDSTAHESIRTSITNISDKISSNASSSNKLQDKSYIDTSISNAVTAHNTDTTTSHTDIRSDISDINDKITSSASSSNKLIDKSYVDTKVTELNNAINSIDYSDDISTAVSNHNSSNSAHSDIRDSISNLSSTVSGIDVAGSISTHNSSVTAHSDIRSDISDLSTAVNSIDVAGAISTHNSSSTAHSDIRSSISDIEDLIPTQASTSNQLADKSFVNSSISTSTSNFIGTFTSLTDLQNYSGTVTTNDYAFVEGVDSDNNPQYNRYKYNGTQWVFEYTLNNSSFTSSQWNAINSGITSSDVTAIGNKYVKPSGGIPSTDMTSEVQTTLGNVSTISTNLSTHTGTKVDSSNGVHNIRFNDSKLQYKNSSNEWVDMARLYSAGTGISISSSGAISGNYSAGTGISISNGTISGNYSAGTGISISNGTISGNYSAGTGVSISNGTISANLNAGTGISISGNTISGNYTGGTGISISNGVISLDLTSAENEGY